MERRSCQRGLDVCELIEERIGLTADQGADRILHLGRDIHSHASQRGCARRCE
jgi:hypothetical protein